MDILSLFISNGALSSALFHLTGAIFGFIVGIFMLKMNLVDCERWDIISVWTGQTPSIEKDQAALKEKQLATFTPVEEIEFALTNKKPIRAYIIANRKEKELSKWALPQELHLKMLQQLFADKHYEAATASMRQYLERHKMQSSLVRMMLAQALLGQNKPKAAIKVLAAISPKELGIQQQFVIQDIQVEAEAMHQKNMEEGIHKIVE